MMKMQPSDDLVIPGKSNLMGEREIRNKYGGKLAKAINRAIRAELPGGNEALDHLTALAGPALHSGWKDRRGNPTPEAAAYFKHKREVVDKMEAMIREKWGVPMEQKKLPRQRPRRSSDTARADRKPVKAYRRVSKAD
jgi:hypothetical protein